MFANSSRRMAVPVWSAFTSTTKPWATATGSASSWPPDGPARATKAKARIALLIISPEL